MNGIDISKWQAGIDLSKVPCDFVICKASGGLGYPNFDFDRQIKQAMSLGKLVGAYHFARDGYTGTTPEQEAEVFLKKVKPYIGKAILVLDWEADAVKLGAGWAKRWLDYVRKETGVTPLLYSYWAEAKQKKWAEVAKTYPLWMAQYANYNKQTGYNADPWGEKTCGQWGSNIAIRQYTSQGYLPGYGGNLDLNLAYINETEWDKLCGKTGTETPEEPADKVGDLARKIATEINDSGLDAAAVLAKVSALLGAKPAEPEKPAEAPAEPEKPACDVDKIALEVLDGKWGNGATRRRRLTAAGYDYQTVQTRVNEIDAERRKGK